MGKLKWSGPWRKTMAGGFMVEFSTSTTFWNLKRNGRLVSKHDSREAAMRKAGRLHAADAKPKRKECGHSESRYTYSRRPDDTFGADALFCLACGVRLDMGPSNDEPAEVQVEMRAAEIAAVRLLSRDEADGWKSYPDGAVVSTGSGWGVGWLARELATHDHRETRNADAWPWDVTRPVAGQYEEWRDGAEPTLAGLTAAIPCEECETADGCSDHEKFTCGACGKLTDWKDGGTDDEDGKGGDECSDCWLKRTTAAPAPVAFAKAPTGEIVNTFADWSEDDDSNPIPGDQDPALRAAAARYLERDEGRGFADSLAEASLKLGGIERVGRGEAVAEPGTALAPPELPDAWTWDENRPLADQIAEFDAAADTKERP